MHIDAHQHFWRYNPDEYDWIDESMSTLRRDFLPDELTSELQTSGFDACITVQARQTLEETRWLLQLANDAPVIAGVIGWVDLRASDVRSQLAEFAANPKFIGVRHIVQSEPDDRFLLRPDFLHGIAALEEWDLTYDILIYPRHLPIAAEFVARFPNQRCVLDHLAKPPIRSHEMQSWEAGIRALAKLPNVMCKLSGLVTEADWKEWRPEHIRPFLDVALDAFGPARLMIGSDWPVCTVAASYARAMGLVKDYLSRFSSQVQDGILGGNAEKLWNLGVKSRMLRTTLGEGASHVDSIRS